MASIKASGASASITITGGVLSLPVVVTGGYGYSPTTPPTVTVVDPTGTGAVITATVGASGEVTGLTLVSGGSGYTDPQLVFLDIKQQNVSDTSNNRTIQSIDPNDLSSQAQVQLDVESIPDTLAGEALAVQALVQDNSTYLTLKLDSVSSSRVSDSAIDTSLTYTVNNSVDRVNNPHTKLMIETTNLASAGTDSVVVKAANTSYAALETAAQAAITAAPTPPDPYLTLASATALRLTDGSLQVVNSWAPFTAAWELENQPTLFAINKGTTQQIDPTGLASKDERTQVLPVSDTALPLGSTTGGKLIEVRQHLATPSFSATTHYYGQNSSSDELVNRRARSTIDPEALASEVILASVNGVEATAGGIASVTVTACGTGYVSPTISLSGGVQGSGATATPTVSGGGVASIAVNAGGTNYHPNAVPQVVITGDGYGADAYAVVSDAGVVTSVVVRTPGTGYTTATVTIPSPTPTFSVRLYEGTIVEITPTQPGANYLVAPTIVITDSAGTGAAAVANIAAGLMLRETVSSPVSPSADMVSNVYTEVDSRRKIELDRTVTSTDPTTINSIDEQTVVAPIWSSALTPTSATGGQLTDVRTKKITNVMQETTFTFKQNTAIQDLTNRNTILTIDPLGLISVGETSSVVSAGATDADLDTAVQAAISSPEASPDASLVLKAVRGKRVTPSKAQIINEWAPFTSAWEVTYDPQGSNRGTESITDPNTIASAGKISSVTATGTPATAPALPAGVKLLDIQNHQLTPSDQITTFGYGVNDTVDRHKFPHTRNIIDPTGLDTVQTIGSMNGVVTPPNAAADVIIQNGGSNYTGSITITVTGASGGATLPTFSTTVTDGIITNVKILTPGSGLGTACTLTASGTTGSGAVLVLVVSPAIKLHDTEVVQITPTQSLYINRYSENTAADTQNNRNTVLSIDPLGLISAGETSSIVSAGATDADLDTAVQAAISSPEASPDASLVLKAVRGKRVTPSKAQIINEWAPFTSAWEVTHGPHEGNRGTESIVDPNTILSAGKISSVTATGTAATVPSIPAGTKIVDIQNHQLTPNDQVTTFGYGVNDSVDRHKFPLTRNIIDPTNIDSMQTIGSMNGVVSPPNSAADVIIQNGGSGYTGTITITVTGAASGATLPTFSTTVTEGVITNVQILTPGSGLGTACTLAAAGTTGSGAVLVLVVSPATQLLATEVVQVTPTQSLYVNRYAENTRAQLITNKTSGEVGIIANANRRVLVTVEACASTDDMTTLAYNRAVSIQYTNYLGIPFFSTSCRRVTPVLCEYTTTFKFLTYRELDPGGHPIITGTTTMGPLTNFNSDASGNYYIHLSSAMAVGSNYVGRTAKGYASGTMRSIKIKLILNGITTVPDNFSLVGAVNSATFFGMLPGTVKYMGATYEVLVNNSGGLTIRITYEFLFWQTGHFIISVPGIVWASTSLAMGKLLIATTSAGVITASTTPTWIAGPVIDTTLPLTDFTTSPWPNFNL